MLVVFFLLSYSSYFSSLFPLLWGTLSEYSHIRHLIWNGLLINLLPFILYHCILHSHLTIFFYSLHGVKPTEIFIAFKFTFGRRKEFSYFASTNILVRFGLLSRAQRASYISLQNLWFDQFSKWYRFLVCHSLCR